MSVLSSSGGEADNASGFVPAPRPENERERIQALHALGILDTLPEDAFDRITRLAARHCRAPIALISFVDHDRQWFKSRIGMPFAETPREFSFCAYTILGDGPLVIPDASQDERFRNSLAVLGPSHIRFYAGIPLITEEGYRLGSLCVIDTVAREGLSDEEEATLVDLAALVMHQLRQQTIRREAEQTARQLSSVLESTSDNVFTVNSDWTFAYCNQRAVRHLTLRPGSPSDLIGLNFWERFSFVAGTPWETQIRKAMEERVPLHMSGEDPQRDIAFDVYFYPSGDGLTVFYRDVTELWRTQQKLEESRRMYQMLVNLCPVGIYETDRRGNLLFANEHMRPLVRTSGGLDAASFAAAFDLVESESREEAKAEWEVCHREGKPFVREIRLVFPDGSDAFVQAQAAPKIGPDGVCTGFVGVIHDLTDHHRAETQLRRFQALLLDAIRVMEDGFALWDKDDRLVVANDAMRRESQYWDVALTEGMSYEKWIREILGSPRFRKATRYAPPMGSEALDKFVRVRVAQHRLGTGVPIERHFETNDRWVVMRDFATSEGGILTLNSDISELKRHTSEMAKMRDVAEAANRAKSDFLASMSHEIRTPLNGVIGFADLLLDDQLTPEQRDRVTLLKDAGKSLLAIINDILDVSKIDAGKLELESIPVDIAAVIKGAIAIVESSASAKGLALETELSANLPKWVLGDPTRLRQILLNLLSNAVKFTDQGGVTVSVTRDPASRGRLRFAVVDTGMGIPADRQQLLFKDFSQTDRSIARRFGGTGLGLAICRRLTAAMGGEIGVTSFPGEGSTFWFTVEAAETTGTDSSSPGGQVISGPATSLRILVAEDVHINRLIIEAMLKAARHQVTMAANGAAAVEAVQQAAFDIILMDMEMPVMDGLTATGAIRNLGFGADRLPIIALTANAMAEQIEACRKAGMNDHLAKPIDRDLMLATIEKWGAGQPGEKRPLTAMAKVELSGSAA